MNALRCSECGRKPTRRERAAIARDRLSYGIKREQLPLWTCARCARAILERVGGDSARLVVELQRDPFGDVGALTTKPPIGEVARVPSRPEGPPRVLELRRRPPGPRKPRGEP